MRMVCRFHYSVFIIIFVNTDYHTKYRLYSVVYTEQRFKDIFISKQMFDLNFFYIPLGRLFAEICLI